MTRESETPGAAPEQRSEQIRLVVADCLRRRSDGEEVSDESIVEAHPKLMPELAAELRKLRASAAARDQIEQSEPDPTDPQLTQRHGLHIRCPHCHNPIELVAESPFTDITCSSCGSHFSLLGDDHTTYTRPTVKKIGHFETIEHLGTGGFGTVWKARDTELDRTVALKIPRKEHLTPVETEQFLREARAAAQLRHPNIVTVYEVGREGDIIYIVSDFVRGVPLSDWLTGQQVTAREAAELCVKITEALHHAHERGVIHRDLKPSNIMIDSEMEPHIMDFGLAKREAGEITMTLDGHVLGTPAYMSPEQAQGEAHRSDRRSDVYSLGVVLFELLTGELPFRGNPRMLVHQVIHDEPPSPRKLNSNVPRDIETICLKCLEKDPDRRYATAQEVGDELRRYLAGKPILARPISKMARTWRWCKRKPMVAGLAAAVVLLLVTGTAISSYFAIAADENARNERLARAGAEAKLYHSLVSEANALRLARKPGYRPLAWSRLKQAMAIDIPAKDTSRIRQVAVACLGDFIANEPIVWEGLNSLTPKMALFPDSRHVALVKETSDETGGRGLSTISIRTIPTNHETATLRIELPEKISDLAITPDGRQLVVCDRSGLVEIWKRNEAEKWERTNRHESFPLFRPTGTVHLRIFPDGRRYLLCWSSGRGFTIRGLTDPKLDKSIPTPYGESLRIPSISPDGRFLAAPLISSSSKTIGIWNVETGKLERQVATPFTTLLETAFTPDGRFLICGADDGFAMYDAKTFQQWSLARLDSVYSMTFMPDSQVMAFSTISRKIRLWNLNSHREIAVIDHGTIPNEVIVRITPDSRWLLSTGKNELRLWRLRGLPEKLTLAGHREMAPCNAFSHDGKLLATGSKDETVRLWDAHTGALLHTFSPGYLPQSIAFSQNGRLLAVGSYFSRNTEHQLTLWDLRSRHRVAAQTVPGGAALGIAFTSDGRQLIVCGHGLTVFDIVRNKAGKNAEEQIELKQRNYVSGSRSLSLAISSDDKTVAFVDRNRSLRVWDLKQRQEHDVFPKKNLLLHGWHNISFLQDDRHVFFIAINGQPQVWDTKTGKMAYEISESPRFLSYHIALSPDGRWLAGDATAEALTIIDVQAKKPLFTLPSERSPIKSVSWSPDGKRIAVGLSDGGASIWDMESVKKQLTEIGLGWK